MIATEFPAICAQKSENGRSSMCVLVIATIDGVIDAVQQPDGLSWHRVYPKATTSPPPDLYTVEEDAVLQLPNLSMSFEPQSQAPITGPAVKRRGGMSQLTMLSEEDEEDEEEEETFEKNIEVVADKTSKSAMEESTRKFLIHSLRARILNDLSHQSPIWRTLNASTLSPRRPLLKNHQHTVCASPHPVQTSKPCCFHALANTILSSKQRRLHIYPLRTSVSDGCTDTCAVEAPLRQ